RAQGAQRQPVRAAGPADAEVDPVGVEAVEGAVGFDDPQGDVVGQHDAAGPDPNAGGVGGGVGDEDLGGGRGDRGHAVMLGVPEAGKAQLVAQPGEIDGAGERVGGGVALGDGREVL